MSSMVRVDSASHAVLSELAQAERAPLTQVLSRAIECYRRQAFLAGVTDDFAAFAASDGWEEEQTERQAWEITTADGLGDG